MRKTDTIDHNVIKEKSHSIDELVISKPKCDVEVIPVKKVKVIKRKTVKTSNTWNTRKSFANKYEFCRCYI